MWCSVYSNILPLPQCCHHAGPTQNITLTQPLITCNDSETHHNWSPDPLCWNRTYSSVLGARRIGGSYSKYVGASLNQENIFDFSNSTSRRSSANPGECDPRRMADLR